MNEAQVNGMLRKSLDFGFKIPDGSMTKLPFDLFGVYQGKGIYIETKYLPKPKSFNFHRLEDHQISSLLNIYNLDENRNNLVSLFLIVVNYGRGDKRVFYYKDMKEIDRRKRNKENILKKEFDISTNYTTISKSLIDFDKILNEGGK